MEWLDISMGNMLFRFLTIVKSVSWTLKFAGRYLQYIKWTTNNNKERIGVTSFFATCTSMQLASVCTPLKSSLLIKLLQLIATLTGQQQVIVNSDRSLSHKMTESSSKLDNMTQWTGHHCCVYSGPTQKSSVNKPVTRIMSLQCLLHYESSKGWLTNWKMSKPLFVKKNSKYQVVEINVWKVTHRFTLPQFLLSTVKVKIHIQALHKLGDWIFVGIRFLQ